MGIGDNFDTSSKGLINQKTGRYTGGSAFVQHPNTFNDGTHESDIFEYYYNGGHPCNIGCGCHDVCEEFATTSSPHMPCYLPEELLISVTQDSYSRHQARETISNLKGGKDTFFLKYYNGAWRGRKGCTDDTPSSYGVEGGLDTQSGIAQIASPCEVTTIEVDPQGVTVKRSNCNYSGIHGSSDPVDNNGYLLSNTNHHEEKRTNKHDLLLSVDGNWVYEGRATENGDIKTPNCLRDGEIAPRLASKCMKLDDEDNLVEHTCGGYCLSDDLVVGMDEEDCTEDENSKWVDVPCTEAECIAASQCIGELSELCDDRCADKTDRTDCIAIDECRWDGKSETCISKNRRVSEFECLACGGDWYPKWVQGDYDASACCGGAVVSDNGPNHQPDLSISGVGGLGKEKFQGTCITPYREAILIPGAQNIATGGAALGAPTPCAGIQNANQRLYLADDPMGQGNYFTLILRGCDYYGDCSSRAESVCTKQTSPPTTTDHDNETDCLAGGACIDLDGKEASGCRVAATQEQTNDSYEKCLGPTLEWFTLDTRETCEHVNAPANVSWTQNQWAAELNKLSHKQGAPGLETVLFIPVDQMLNCSNFDLTVKSTIAGAEGTHDNTWGQARWLDSRGNIDGNPAGFYPGTYNYGSSTSLWCAMEDLNLDGDSDYGTWCQEYVYYESGFLGGTAIPSSFARISNPKGHYKLRALNIHPQPFKATEQEQKKHKTYDQAVADAALFSACIDSGVSYWQCYDGCIAEGDTHENCDTDCGEGMGGAFCNWDMTQGYDFWFKNDFAYTAADNMHAAGGPCRTIGRKVLDWTSARYGETQCGGRCNGSGMPGEVGPNWKTWFPCEEPTCMYLDSESQEPILVTPTECGARGLCLSEKVSIDNLSPDVIAKNNGKENCEDLMGGHWQGCGWSNAPEGCQPGECVDVDGEDVGINGRIACEDADYTWMSLSPTISNCPCSDHDNASDCNSEWCKFINGTCEPLGECGSNHCGSCRSTFEIPSDLKDLVYGYSHNGTKLIQPNIAGDSLDYWGRTGLYPNPDEAGISHVADSCVGTNRSGKIEMASNTMPAIIRSKNHLLKNGDKIEITGVMGNFRVNRMTNRDWQETVWEDKDCDSDAPNGCKCKGDHCDNQAWPNVKCPENDVLVSGEGKCPYKVTFSDGTSVESCYNAKDENGNPLPAPWFVVEKYDDDTFKLFTCDGEPLDARVTRSGWSSCNDLSEGVKVCGSFVATHNGLRPSCPCQTVTGTTAFDMEVVSSNEVALEDEATCSTYGGCEIIAGGNPPGTDPDAILTKSDCEKLAKVFVSYDTVNGNHEFVTGGIYAPCVDSGNGNEIDASGCWQMFDWDNEDNFQTGDVGDADDGASEIDSWTTCPYTGEWMISPETLNMTPYDYSQNVYRDGWDGTGVARFDLPNMSDNYYVQIEQRENCPVCADHFMPTNLVATIHPQDTSIFRLLKAGFSRCNRTLTGGLKNYADGFNCSVFQNEECGQTHSACLQDCMENDEVNGDNICLTEHCRRKCCDDCGLNPVKAIKPTHGIYDDAGNINPNGGKLIDPCCNCECTSMDDNVFGRQCDGGCPTYPTLDEFEEHCGGCGDDGNWVCHPLGCDHMKCRTVADVYMCSYNGDDGTSADAQDCSDAARSTAVDTDGDGRPDTCIRSMDTTGFYFGGGGGAAGSVIADCKPEPMGGHCECVPCTGYPKGRSDICESDFISCDDQVAGLGAASGWCGEACKEHGVHLDGTWGRDNTLLEECPQATNEAECYLNKGCLWRSLAVGGECIPNNCDGAQFPPSTASAITCYETQYDVRDGCPGLDKPWDVPLVYNGGYWASDWLFMGDPTLLTDPSEADDRNYVGGMTCKGCTDWGFSCSLHDWPSCCLGEGRCINDCGNLAYPTNPFIVDVKEWCVENGHTWKPVRTTQTCWECDCGSCSTMNDERDFSLNMSKGPRPEPAKDGHWARFNLACADGRPIPGDGQAMDGNARFNLTGDYYYNNQLGLSWEITTCAFHGCRSDQYKPPCPKNIIDYEESSADWDFGCYGCSKNNKCVNTHGGCGETECGKCSSRPTGDCNGTPPCISCCNINTDGYATCPTLGVPPHRSDTHPFCFGTASTIEEMYPDWWFKGEGMTVYHVEMDDMVPDPDNEGFYKRNKGYDTLTVKLSNSKCCAGGPPDWPTGWCSKSTEDYPKETEAECLAYDGIWHPTYVSTGRADRIEAELGNLNDYSRNNTSRNPVMGLGRTELVKAIPTGGQRHDSGFWEVQVKDASLLRTGNAALDRHLQRRQYEEGRGLGDSKYATARFRYVDGGFVREEAYPYGLSPWPVPHQSPSSTGSMYNNRLESLREPFRGVFWTQPYIAPGRIGLLPTAELMHKLYETVEASKPPAEDPPADDGGSGSGIGNESDPSTSYGSDYGSDDSSGDSDSELMSFEQDSLEDIYKRQLHIAHIENRYHDDQGACSDASFTDEASCTAETDSLGRNLIWIPKFKDIYIKTEQDHDFTDGEKIIISGAVTYPAECVDPRDDDSPPGDCIIESAIDDEFKSKKRCEEGYCFINGARDLNLDKDQCEWGGGDWCDGGEWQSRLPDMKVDETICKAYGGEFKTRSKWYEFIEGCSAHCRLGGLIDRSGKHCEAAGGTAEASGNCQETLEIDKGSGEPEYKVAESLFDDEHVVKVIGPNSFSIHYEHTIDFEDFEASSRLNEAHTPYLAANVGSAHNKSVETYDPSLAEHRDACEKYNTLNCEQAETMDDCDAAEGCLWDQSDSKCNKDKKVCLEHDFCKLSGADVCSTQMPIDTTDEEELWEEKVPAGKKFGHEIGIGPAKNIYKSVIYNRMIKDAHIMKEVSDDCENYKNLEGTEFGCGGSYVMFNNGDNMAIWSRHGGLFDINVGAKEPINDAHQMNSTTPVNLTYYVTAHESCCNIFQPPVLYECQSSCYEGYGPWRGLPYDEQGAVFKVTVTESGS